jgi:hypothetical protein
MTQWGFFLLCVYVALGVSRMSWRKAGTAAAMMTAIIMAAVFASYGALR